MTNLALLVLLGVLAGRLLVGSLPHVCIGDLRWPSDVEYVALTCADEFRILLKMVFVTRTHMHNSPELSI